ncbi:hypothetical protein QYM36_005202 [Artemia franciscana]|uniref:Uncharacterized protein n=1 Tax=Artemia franciscana TaxID=6661 RepID=A0AA88LAZ2_ARTSF|nr:hypothetical protein QYM36_005202 [Artemia franciscana]
MNDITFTDFQRSVTPVTTKDYNQSSRMVNDPFFFFPYHHAINQAQADVLSIPARAWAIKGCQLPTPSQIVNHKVCPNRIAHKE